jgi:2-(1,2-epoxy-1,2-dihydrophenyl)acetyl-CoA isomerase
VSTDSGTIAADTDIDASAATTAEPLIESGPVLLDLDGGVARLRLNRPEASNGLDVPLLKALYDALMRCHGEPRVRALLLSGEGPNFCAGGDVKTFASKGAGLPDYLREATSWLQICASALMRLQAPVVTIVHGFAAGGGGVGLVCASDIVIAAESARFLLGATRVGMAPDAGSSVTLGRLVGHRRAMEIALTNPTITAVDALDMGLVTRVVADDALLGEGLALARELATGPTRALAATKRLLWDGLGRSVEESLPDESRTVSELSGTDDAREGLAAVIERRAPRYEGR